LWSHGWNEIRLLMLDEGAGVESAFLTHAGWASEEGGRGVHVKKNPGVVFKLEEHSISDPDSGYSRLIRLQRGPSDRRHHLCLLLDGEIYWRDMGVMEILNGLVESGKIPGMTFAFVGCVSGPARQEDLVCNERYLRFISGRVMEWLKAEIPSLEDGGHLIGGLSLSGLMSTFIALNDPGHFGACLSQSGSHWWRHEWFNSVARGLAPVYGRFWLSVGDQETQTNLHHSPTLCQEISQIEGVGKLAVTLSEAGGEVHCHRHPGGHSFLPWKEELGDALCWLTEQR
ncbi:MAG: esterase family protein, partial [Verrucomicrobiaceae bacterium]